ncbi:accessory Sec system translocase SecA2 [Rugosimonospora africana]|uniref:Protein translocase subunit SecA n=1 Tax=Rugosimonospora africana TaxID=556532 RepID=A0A8J3VVC5_9ACTN|nr:accessory Sec system translocase SecA2 [Rugosimonospora africana]GIH20502.1 protein translocase subunit SecA [Rugosimonospora africana]
MGIRAGFDRLRERPGTVVDTAALARPLSAIEAREASVADLDDAGLAAAAASVPADDLVEICALGREAARRGLGQRPYDVQLVGALAMLAGHVAQMATGEGKTLAAAIAAFGYVRRGSPVHVLTVNDYLARRDAEWMAPVYRALGITVGWVTEQSTVDERRDAYRRDVTYVSVSEVGFDYLRDGLCLTVDDRVQRPLATVIVDEADSILIDEARVPLVVAGGVEGADDLARRAAAIVRRLRGGSDFERLDDGRAVHLTEAGLRATEAALGGINLYAVEHLPQLTAVNLALHARELLHRDVDYIVRDGAVELVDEFRGRVALRRRWPDGLQAAVEAKEGLTLSAQGEVLATITVQALIGLYPTRCGMSATAAGVGDALREFYRVEVAVIEPNRPCVRVDEPDRVYLTTEDKHDALLAEIRQAHEAGRPVLVGTLDVEESERLAADLRAGGVPCTVLNAKNDAAEAAIIAEAGSLGTVTVSTQMAGRGTDIRLGGGDQAGHDQVAALGGLYIIGTGRHDSGRVDAQLRGRAGRQGDPGRSVFFVSLDDSLVLTHAGNLVDRVRQRAEFDDDGRVPGRKARRLIAHAQRVAEGSNAELHRNTWRYGYLIERQRRALARRREELLTTDAPARLLAERSGGRYESACERVGAPVVDGAARAIALFHLDRCWAEHLAYLSEIREGVHLRVLGRLDPLDEFHRCAVPAFRTLFADAEQRTLDTFDTVDLSGDGWSLADAGLVRPSATWTYLVTDDPFGSELSRFFKAVLGPAPRES